MNAEGEGKREKMKCGGRETRRVEQGTEHRRRSYMSCNHDRNWNLVICEREKQGVSDGSGLVAVRQMRHPDMEPLDQVIGSVLIGGNGLGGPGRMRIELF